VAEESKLNTLLAGLGIASTEELKQAEEQVKEEAVTLEEAIQKTKAVSGESKVSPAEEGASQPDEKTQEMENRARKMRVRYVDISKVEIDKETAALIPEQMASRYQLVCIGKIEKKITLAMVDPIDIFAVDDVKLRTGYDVEPVLASPDDIKKAIDTVYGTDAGWKDKVLKDLSEQVVQMVKDDEEAGEEDVVIDQPIIIAVNKIISESVLKKASDIHIEPFERELLVRFRIDGVLHEIMNLPKAITPALVSRIKIMSNMKIDERRVPQDGRIHMQVANRDLDIRVSTVPTTYGESIVMRLLDRSRMKIELTTLGFSDRDLAGFQKLIERPNGIILVTGPTGSGKSTTLYAALGAINDPTTKVVTIEDPIEYTMKGVIQVQANNKVGLDFSRALRAFLRQDPDVMMVGEIRDKETATIAVESALTGHLVLSTLHTNDAVGSVTRLIDMGVEPFLISSTCIGVLAQRLVRKVCSKCAEPFEAFPDLLDILKKNDIPMDNLTLMKGKGCDNCSGTGYSGRMGIYELMIMSDELRDMIIRRVPSSQLMALAREQGLRTLHQDGLLKVSKGVTAYEELCRVTAE